MTSATTAYITNGFVFVPASSFLRDDRGDESLLPYEIGQELPTPNKLPALTPEQQQLLRMVYDANTTPEARGGVDGVYLDISTAVQWGLIPPPALPGDVVHYPSARLAPEPAPSPQQQARLNPQAAGFKPSPTQGKVSRKARSPKILRPWERKVKLTPPWVV